MNEEELAKITNPDLQQSLKQVKDSTMFNPPQPVQAEDGNEECEVEEENIIAASIREGVMNSNKNTDTFHGDGIREKKIK
jgi:FATC domain